jgi:hypothetical protein
MAVAFGVGASVVSVVGLTIQISQIVVQFGLDWKDAPKDVKTFRIELSDLQKTLCETQTRLLASPTFAEAAEGQSLATLSQLGPDLDSCQAELTEVVDGLKRQERGHRFGWERFKGPFISKKTQKTMERLRWRCQNFNNQILIDATLLTAMTRIDVKEARTEQKEWHEADENQKLLRWLSRLDFEEKHRDILSKRHPGTGEWLLNLDDFKAWRNGQLDTPSI